jgi:gentisate 1,2-dioxygenase
VSGEHRRRAVSESDERAVWMDALDIPLNNFLDASFFENHPRERQEVDKHLAAPS